MFSLRPKQISGTCHVPATVSVCEESGAGMQHHYPRVFTTDHSLWRPRLQFDAGTHPWHPAMAGAI